MVISLFSTRLHCCCHLGAPVFPSAAVYFFSFPGSCFVRTDQLDGETDWKLRLPVACTQRLPTAAVSRMQCNVNIGIWFSQGLLSYSFEVVIGDEEIKANPQDSETIAIAQLSYLANNSENIYFRICHSGLEMPVAWRNCSVENAKLWANSAARKTVNDNTS